MRHQEVIEGVEGLGNYLGVAEDRHEIGIAVPAWHDMPVQMAGQAAWVIPFLKGALQMQTFVQAVAGINWVQEAGAASTTVQMKHYSMAQGVGGMQVVYTLPGTDKHLQLFVQAQKSITGTPSS